MGSGIFTPVGPLNYTYDRDSGSKLITAKIPLKNKNKLDSNQKVFPTVIEMSQVTGEFENISLYTKAVMTKGEYEILTLCHNETFCCEASYNISNNNNSRYTIAQLIKQ